MSIVGAYFSTLRSDLQNYHPDGQRAIVMAKLASQRFTRAILGVPEKMEDGRVTFVKGSIERYFEVGTISEFFMQPGEKEGWIEKTPPKDKLSFSYTVANVYTDNEIERYLLILETSPPTR